MKTNPPSGADWTQLLADPDLISHIGQLLEVYRTAPPEMREKALLETMRKIKADAGSGQAEALPSAGSATAPPFEPDLYKPTSADDRRRYPRMKCFVAIELKVAGSPVPIWGNLANTSVGGCLIETATPLPSGTTAEIGLWVAAGKLWVKGIVLNGIVAGTRPSMGVRVKFDAMAPEARETLRQFLEYVENTTNGYRKQHDYLAQMKR